MLLLMMLLLPFALDVVASVADVGHDLRVVVVVVVAFVVATDVVVADVDVDDVRISCANNVHYTVRCWFRTCSTCL